MARCEYPVSSVSLNQNGSAWSAVSFQVARTINPDMSFHTNPIKQLATVCVLLLGCAASGSADELRVPEPCRAVAESAELGLLDVVELALCGNPQTREVWAGARYQQALLGVSRAAYHPALNGTAGVTRSGSDRANVTSPVDSKSAALTLSYLIYDFGARGASLENARQLLAAASATQDNTVQALFLSAVQAYYQVQAAQAALASAKEAERAAQESLKAATLRYTVGSAAPADKLQAQTAYAQATLNRIQAAGTLRSAQGNLANVIGRDANRPVNIISTGALALPNEFERSVDELIAAARARRPDLRAAEAQLNAAQANVEAARMTDMPSLAFGATATNSRGDLLSPGNSYDLSLKLSVPLYSGYAATNRVYAAQAQAESRLAQRDRLHNQVALEVWNAYQNLLTATQSLRTTVALVNSAEQSAHVAAARYQAGMGSMLDVLVAQSTMAGARQQRVQAAYNWNIYRATLAQSMGSLDIALLSRQGASPDGGADQDNANTDGSTEKSQP